MNEEHKTELHEGLGGAVDLFFVYRFAKYMAQNWESWPAYKTGVIDNKGNLLLKANQRKTAEQKQSYTVFHRLVRKLRQLLEKIPGMKGKLGKAAAAYFLFREHARSEGIEDMTNLDEAFLEHVNKTMTMVESTSITISLIQNNLMENKK
jgi:hypothetical protein